MMYDLIFAKQAKEDLVYLKRNEPAVYKKASSILLELQEHPRTGTGKPEPLTGDRSGQWSRRLNHRHRLVYEIAEEKVFVYVLSSYGHYGDK